MTTQVAGLDPTELYVLACGSGSRLQCVCHVAERVLAQVRRGELRRQRRVRKVHTAQVQARFAALERLLMLIFIQH